MSQTEKSRFSYHAVPTDVDRRVCEDAQECTNDKLADNQRLVSEEKDSAILPKNDNIVVIPPDGGWGWVVVLGSFMCNLIVDGIIFSFGIFLDSIAEEFGVKKTEVTFVGSLMSGFYLIAGPFASAIANAYGFRIVAIAGTLIAAAAFAVSHFATGVTFLCITYGVIGGIGFGLIYVPSVISIGFYFERWRALATGIAVCGSGIGTFVFAPLSQMLVDNFGWRGALLCQGAMVLSCVVYGSLFRPLKPTVVEECEIVEKPDIVVDIDKIPLRTRSKMEEAIEALKRNSLKYIPEHQISLPVLCKKDTSKSSRIWDLYHQNAKSVTTMDIYTPEKTLSVPFLADADKAKLEKKSGIDNSKGFTQSKTRNNSVSQDKYEIPVLRKDAFYGASLVRLPQYTSKSSVAYHLSMTKIPTPIEEEEEIETSCRLLPKSFCKMMVNILDFSLMKSPSFWILAVGGFFTMMGFYVPYMYLQERAKPEMGDLSVWLISSIGIANTIGRVVCGVISSLPGVNALFVTNVALTVGGLATMLSGVSLSAGYQFLYTVLFGLATACFASLRSIVVVDLLGLEKLTNAFGLLLLFQGIAAIIGSPLAGAFWTFTGDFNACFYLSGGVLLFSAIMCYPLNYVNKRERESNSRQDVV